MIDTFQVRDRIYDRHADLFGTIEEINDSRATVRYEWPHDGKTTTEVFLKDLAFASDYE